MQTILVTIYRKRIDLIGAINLSDLTSIVLRISCVLNLNNICHLIRVVDKMTKCRNIEHKMCSGTYFTCDRFKTRCNLDITFGLIYVHCFDECSYALALFTKKTHLLIIILLHKHTVYDNFMHEFILTQLKIFIA